MLSRVIIKLILTISLLFSTHTTVEGRRLVEVEVEVEVEEGVEKVALIGQMGSRPPRCEGKCRNCGHCEAIQVPTTSSNSAAGRSTVAYARGDGYSDYKPMSWKCKCGSSLFNP